VSNQDGPVSLPQGEDGLTDPDDQRVRWLLLGQALHLDADGPAARMLDDHIHSLSAAENPLIGTLRAVEKPPKCLSGPTPEVQGLMRAKKDVGHVWPTEARSASLEEDVPDRTLEGVLVWIGGLEAAGGAER
jgi:hypothetical protein